MAIERIVDIKLTCTQGTSNKYWNGQLWRKKERKSTAEYEFAAKYGRIGTTGQKNTIPQPTAFGAFSALLKKLKEKIQKGYVFEPDSYFTEWEDYFEPDLKVAANRFALNAMKLDGWREPRGMREFLSTATKRRIEPRKRERTSEWAEKQTTADRLVEREPDEPKSSIKKILEQRRKHAAVSI